MVKQMPNGYCQFVLIKNANWNDFDNFAKKFCNCYSFNVLSKADSVELNVRLKDIEKDGVVIAIVYDGWMSEINLESETKDGYLLISNIAENWDENSFNFYMKLTE